MELTPAQRHLIRWLKVMGCTEEETIGIFLFADTPEKRDELMMYMAENLTATPQDILEKLEQILKKDRHIE
jgi:hypothetical protein